MVDGADLMFLSYSLSSIKKDFGLTNVEAGMLGSVTLVGMAIGGIYGGWASDRFGRVRTVVWTILVFSLSSAALGTTHGLWDFAAYRFIGALGLGAEYVVCNTLMAEYVPTHQRTTVLGTLQAGWSVGYVVAALIASWILPHYGWRWLFYIATVPVVMALLMQRIVPEPPNWVAARAKASADKAAGVVHSVKKESVYKIIFGDAGHRRMFTLWALTSCFLQFGYYGVNNWMPSYLEKELARRYFKWVNWPERLRR